ncbi:jg12681, partial [Pararge aegeria aegeria]
ESLLLLLVASGLALSADPCCPNNEVIKARGYCDNNSTEQIKLNCSMGRMLLSDVILNGDKVSTKDSPNYIFVEDPRLYCLGQMYLNASEPSQGLIPVAVTCFEKIQKNDIETGGILTLVSVVFLLATFSIYMYLPQLR